MAKIIKNGIEYNHSTTNFEIGETPPLDPSVELWFDTSEEMPMADYIVERGTTDGWEWEKWASGKVNASKQSPMPLLDFTNYSGVVKTVLEVNVPDFMTLVSGKCYIFNSFCSATFSTEHSTDSKAVFNVFSSYPYTTTNAMSYRCEIIGVLK